MVSLLPLSGTSAAVWGLGGWLTERRSFPSEAGLCFPSHPDAPGPVFSGPALCSWHLPGPEMLHLQEGPRPSTELCLLGLWYPAPGEALSRVGRSSLLSDTRRPCLNLGGFIQTRGNINSESSSRVTPRTCECANCLAFTSQGCMQSFGESPGLTTPSKNLERLSSLTHLIFSPPVLHTQGPVDDSLYAKVRKKSSSDPGVPGGPPAVPATSSPNHSDHTLSVSSDSGHSMASGRTDRTEEHPGPGPKRGLSPQEKAELDQLLSGFGLEDPGSPLQDMSDGHSKCGGTHHVVPAQVHVNGDAAPKDREMDILDDEMPGHDLCNVESTGTLSSSEGHASAHLSPFACHQSSQNSLLSDGFGSSTGEDQHGAPAPDLGLGGDPLYERECAFWGREPRPPQPVLRKPPAPAPTQAYGQSGYSTQTWVRQQQMVAAHHLKGPVTRRGRWLSPPEVLFHVCVPEAQPSWDGIVSDQSHLQSCLQMGNRLENSKTLALLHETLPGLPGILTPGADCHTCLHSGCDDDGGDDGGDGDGGNDGGDGGDGGDHGDDCQDDDGDGDDRDADGDDDGGADGDDDGDYSGDDGDEDASGKCAGKPCCSEHLYYSRHYTEACRRHPGLHTHHDV
ncbi:Tensin-3 [Camelus dromedarius]|uniref:Tensin-3 n=1 Tax=Camelus dromedarius TaxID=9838 RepID=A0A5N4C4D3_CAMDR|nr:Tensin-3 [Camelus dromedarius]